MSFQYDDNPPAPDAADPTLHPEYYRHGMIEHCRLVDPRPGATFPATDLDSPDAVTVAVYVANSTVMPCGRYVSFCRVRTKAPGEDLSTNFLPVLGPYENDVSVKCASTKSGPTRVPVDAAIFLFNIAEAQLASEYDSRRSYGSGTLYALCKVALRIHNHAVRVEAEKALQDYFKQLKALYRKPSLPL